MRMFNKVNGYATQENAIKGASKFIDLNTVNWIMTVNDEGRFQVCVKGAQYIHLAHTGKICVTD